MKAKQSIENKKVEIYVTISICKIVMGFFTSQGNLKMRKLLFLSAFFFVKAVTAETYKEAHSIVSIGGPITEIIYALGEENRLVARDSTSLYPSGVEKLPDVGYMRRLSAEGVLSVAPDLIIARETSGPPEVLEQLESASIPIIFVAEDYSAESVLNSIEVVGQALGVNEKAKNLKQKVNSELQSLKEKVAKIDKKKRVLFILSNRGGRLNVAGKNTGANGVIELAGAINVMADFYSGYKISSAEAIISAAPDVVVMMEGRGDHSGSKKEILSLSSISETPAGKTNSFILIPPSTLGFGPRTPALIKEFHQTLYGK